MSALALRYVLNAFIAFVALVAVISLGGEVVRILTGQIPTTIWPVVGPVVETRPLGGQAEIAFNEGLLSVAGHWPSYALMILTKLLFIVGTLVMAWSLRTIVKGVSEGHAFSDLVIDRLRRIGWIGLGLCAWSLVYTWVQQVMLLAQTDAPAGTVLHPSFSWDIGGVENIWLQYSPPVEILIIGLTALLFARAFELGRTYREDSEEIV